MKIRAIRVIRVLNRDAAAVSYVVTSIVDLCDFTTSVILKSIAFILSNMSEVTVQIPDDLGIIMRRHASINWSNIASEAIRKTAAEVELFAAIASESRLTEEDALVLGKKVKKGMWEKVYKNLV